jgi:hypothetical protein
LALQLPLLPQVLGAAYGASSAVLGGHQVPVIRARRGHPKRFIQVVGG